MTSLEKFVFADVQEREGNIVSREEKRLILAYENLMEMPQNLIEDYGSTIEILDLSHNKFTNLQFLTQFDKLTTIILDHNNLNSEVQFPRMPRLTTLWMNHNAVDKLHPLMENIHKAFPSIKFLSIMGNVAAPSYLNGGTYYEYLQYRLYVISWLQKLEYLDDRPVSQDQREEAQRLHSRPFYKSLTKLPVPQYLNQVQRKVKDILDLWAPKQKYSPCTTPSNRII